ncbi:hypothetical protein [Streptomyces flavidovirens]|uniref:MarR family transcriptional regulator n=1 Tax=Streptomyces flavidovirens TaxID=67298 RepID=A0ABW6RF50_9ACTN
MRRGAHLRSTGKRPAGPTSGRASGKENAIAGLRELAAELSEEGTDEARRLLRAVERNLNNLT